MKIEYSDRRLTSLISNTAIEVYIICYLVTSFFTTLKPELISVIAYYLLGVFWQCTVVHFVFNQKVRHNKLLRFFSLIVFFPLLLVYRQRFSR